MQSIEVERNLYIQSNLHFLFSKTQMQLCWTSADQNLHSLKYEMLLCCFCHPPTHQHLPRQNPVKCCFSGAASQIEMLFLVPLLQMRDVDLPRLEESFPSVAHRPPITSLIQNDTPPRRLKCCFSLSCR